MAKEDLIEFDGEITELLPEGRFRVRLENGKEILAYTAGRMKKNRIRSLVGDRVTVEMTPRAPEATAEPPADSTAPVPIRQLLLLVVFVFGLLVLGTVVKLQLLHLTLFII